MRIVSGSTDGMSGMIRAVTVAAVLAAAAVWVFSPITRGDFFLDDLVRLYDLKNWGWTKLILSPHGGHLLATSNASYWLFDRAFGLAPRAWFVVVLAVHVINVLLLYDVTRRMAGDRRLAFLASTLWGVAPVQVGVLGWLAAFGNALVATTLLLLLRELTLAVARTRPPSAPRIAWWYVLALLGATSFGFGIAVAMVLPVGGYLLLCGVPERGGVPGGDAPAHAHQPGGRAPPRRRRPGPPHRRPGPARGSRSVPDRVKPWSTTA